jgi:cell division protein FtsB
MSKICEADLESDVTIIFQASCSMKVPFAKFAYVVAFLIVVSYAFITLRGPHGVAALMEKRAQIHQLEQRNIRLNQEIERKREHIKRLSDNPGEQELEIRERLKLVNPNDKVYIIGERQKK